MTTEQEARQIALEEDSIGLGIERYNNDLKRNGEAQMPPGMYLVKKTIGPVAQAITEWVTACSSGRARDYASIAHFLEGIPAEVIAYIVAKQCIHAISRDETVTNVALHISNMILDEINIRMFAKGDRKSYEKTKPALRKSTSQRHQRGVVRARMKRAGINPESWGKDVRLRMGRKLLELFIDTAGLVEVHTYAKQIKKQHSTVYKLTGTQEAITWLKENHQKNELLSPVFLPMIVPPKPWTNPFNGGYLTLKTKMIKTHNRNYLEELRGYDMPLVYRAINTLQDVPWKVNRKIFDVVREVWSSGGTLGNLPAQEDNPLPTKPVDIETNPVSLRRWKHHATMIHASNARAWSKRMALSVQLQTAGQFLEKTIYFPYTMDWRGRLYPIPAILNPQSNDIGKALLHFAEGKALGERGVWWLKIHTANLFGIDKVSMEERIAWVEAHKDEILDSALNPLDGGRLWATADKPYQALAACFELEGYWREGPGFISRLPIAMDGSCNGIQNFSAMLRDLEGGAAVNLTPQDKPQDIYNRVAEVVARKVEVDAKDGVKHAAEWVGNVTRKIVKRPVMTLPYGATRFGMRQQILEELVKLHEDGCCPVYNEYGDYYWVSDYLSHVVYNSIGEVVKAARQAMDWLQGVAKVAAQDGMPIHWTTPAGLPVLQAYHKFSEKRIQCMVDGRRVRSTIQVPTLAIDRLKQAQGIAPNFVHSMDASHLMLTVNEALSHGVTAFSMVHDSYATHACDVDTLAVDLRAMFVYQYQTHDVLQEFKDQLSAQIGEELAAQLPVLPEKGNLDLNVVNSSVFFFA